MMKHTLLLSCLLSLYCWGDTSEIQQQAVDEIVRSGRIRENLEQGFRNMLPMVAQRASQLNLSQEQTQAYITEYEKWFAEDLDIDGLVKQSGMAYCEHFTSEELLELAAFYRTPLGKKCLEKLPIINKVQKGLAMKEGQKKNMILQSRLRPFLVASTTTIEPKPSNSQKE